MTSSSYMVLLLPYMVFTLPYMATINYPISRTHGVGSSPKKRNSYKLWGHEILLLLKNQNTFFYTSNTNRMSQEDALQDTPDLKAVG